MQRSCAEILEDLEIVLFMVNLTFVCPCIVSITVNDDQQDATILAYLFIPNQLYVFRATSSPIIRIVSLTGDDMN